MAHPRTSNEGANPARFDRKGTVLTLFRYPRSRPDTVSGGPLGPFGRGLLGAPTRSDDPYRIVVCSVSSWSGLATGSLVSDRRQPEIAGLWMDGDLVLNVPFGVGEAVVAPETMPDRGVALAWDAAGWDVAECSTAVAENG